MSFRPLSALSDDERAAAERLLEPDAVLTFYWATAIEDLARGIDNRLVRFCAGGRGLVIGAVFGDLTVFSYCGAIDDIDIAACTVWPGAVEIHAPSDDGARYQAIAGQRLALTRDMILMAASLRSQDHAVEGWRLLGPDDESVVAAFYRTHYPETVFDSYMLFMPFVGAFQEGEMLAGAGTLVISDRLRAALIGHFATAETARGKGHAGRLGRALMQVLGARGFQSAYLATTLDNAAAIRVYERLGFGTIDRRLQLDLMP